MSRKMNWSLAKSKTVTFDELEALKEKIIELGGVRGHKTNRFEEEWKTLNLVWNLDTDTPGVKKLYIQDPLNVLADEGLAEKNRCWYIFKAKTNDKAVVLEGEVKAGMLIEQEFEKQNGLTLNAAFSRTKYSEFGKCVPKPLYYIDRSSAFCDFEGTSLLDVTSMYPASARGRLPDAHIKARMTVQGRAEPNEEYPFAFYLKSGHCAEYGVFDTHDYLKLDRQIRPWITSVVVGGKKVQKYAEVSDEEEVTVLMKAAKYEMTDTFLHFYEMKKNGNETEKVIAKFIMNKGIGCLHKNPKHFSKAREDYQDFYHIAAIIKGRANAKMLTMRQELIENGAYIYQIVVDSFIYDESGMITKLGFDEKVLGEFYREHTNCTYRSNGKLNRYALEKDGKIVKAVVAGFEGAADKITKLEDIDDYVEVEGEQR